MTNKELQNYCACVREAAELALHKLEMYMPEIHEYQPDEEDAAADTAEELRKLMEDCSEEKGERLSVKDVAAPVLLLYRLFNLCRSADTSIHYLKYYYENPTRSEEFSGRRAELQEASLFLDSVATDFLLAFLGDRNNYSDPLYII